jgi:D-serine deaminase-like pyridoxal phosphate-dependent protein
MAQTTGLVQQLVVFSGPSACAWIGPTATNSEVLVVNSGTGSTADVAFAESLIQTLSAAATNYRAVVAAHNDTDAIITSVSIDPV